MQQTNEIEFKRHRSAAVLDIKGDVTAFSEPCFRDAYETLSREAAQRVILKFEQDVYINSGGIAVLIQLLARGHKENRQFAIAGLCNHFKKIFKMVGITKFAQTYDSVEEAADALDGA